MVSIENKKNYMLIKSTDYVNCYSLLEEISEKLIKMNYSGLCVIDNTSILGNIAVNRISLIEFKNNNFDRNSFKIIKKYP